MRAAQWLLPTGSTVFVGCIGRDTQGQTLRQVAEADGLQVEYLEDGETPTGTCAVLVTQQGKCRSLVANLAAANKYKIDHVRGESVQNILHQSKCIYISGYFLTVAPDAIMEIVSKDVREQGKVSLA
jgi:adenosine kinase